MARDKFRDRFEAKNKKQSEVDREIKQYFNSLRPDKPVIMVDRDLPPPEAVSPQYPHPVEEVVDAYGRLIGYRHPLGSGFSRFTYTEQEENQISLVDAAAKAFQVATEDESEEVKQRKEFLLDYGHLLNLIGKIHEVDLDKLIQHAQQLEAVLDADERREVRQLRRMVELVRNFESVANDILSNPDDDPTTKRKAVVRRKRDSGSPSASEPAVEQ